MNCLDVGRGLKSQPAATGRGWYRHVAGCLTLHAIFPQRRMQVAGVSPILRIARLCRISHSGMSCNKYFDTINRRAVQIP